MQAPLPVELLEVLQSLPLACFFSGGLSSARSARKRRLSKRTSQPQTTGNQCRREDRWPQLPRQSSRAHQTSFRLHIFLASPTGRLQTRRGHWCHRFRRCQVLLRISTSSCPVIYVTQPGQACLRTSVVVSRPAWHAVVLLRPSIAAMLSSAPFLLNRSSELRLPWSASSPQAAYPLRRHRGVHSLAWMPLKFLR